MIKQYWVYILANCRNGTLYIGVTSDLLGRTWTHKEGLFAGFSKKYDVKMLVYYEEFGSIELAILREKQLKKWNRQWKLELVEKFNPEWKDLYEGICG